MNLEFRIDWGYSYLYSRRHYHPFYRWDGHLECTNGNILECRKLDYPVIWFGPGHCAHETKLPKAEWSSTTRRGLSGVHISADVNDDTRFRLVTESAVLEFSAKEILNQGRLQFPIGPKYQGCHVIVTRDRYYWFRPAPKAGQQAWEADELPGKVHDWARMRVRWLEPGESLTWTVNVPAPKKEFCETLLHLQVMVAPAYTPGKEEQVCDNFPMEILCDGKSVWKGNPFLRYHDDFMQLLEDVWPRFHADAGMHAFTLKNLHPQYCLLISRITLQNSNYDHMQLSLPEWALVNEPLIGKVFATHQDKATIEWPGGSIEKELTPGWNEFQFSLATPGVNVPIKAGNTTATIGAVYDLPEETPHATVGYDMTVVPHDKDTGFMEWLLDYTWRTRLGNLVVFRSFLYPKGTRQGEPLPADGTLIRQWADYCRTHNIHVEAATDFEDGNLVAGAGDMLHFIGRHEWPGAVYAFDPKAPYSSSNMKEAMEHYLAWLKIEIDKSHKAAPGKAAFGDASGGHRYCYMAGADFLRTETMVPHTMHLCSQARPAAEVFQKGEWGVHIAIQHAYQPYNTGHLGQYYLSLYQPWLMGANMIYEEDSLFVLFKEERQSWDDALTKGKRDMTRDFFRFVKTHPRQAKPERNIAFVEGRYAAPFNGFICDVEQTPDYSVWGLFGNDAPEWGHRQPEKCRQVLDVLMPGASTHPLRQKFDKRRFFFSGTPYGDFDEIPTEASADYFQNYKLLLHLGWNTMIDEDHAKLLAFVQNGGTLLIGLPQFSTHTKRDFLKEMDDLALFRNGDLSELCGFRVIGQDKEFSGTWNGLKKMSMSDVELSALPSNSPTEDGSCKLAQIELAGAEIIAWDANTSCPLLTSFQCGKGRVICLTAYAYFGHERLQQFSAQVVSSLADSLAGNIRVDSPTRELFWNVRHVGEYAEIGILNTDWTVAGNSKPATIRLPNFSFQTEVREQQVKFILANGDTALEYGAGIHVEIQADGSLAFHGTGRQTIFEHHRNGACTSRIIDFTSSTCNK